MLPFGIFALLAMSAFGLSSMADVTPVDEAEDDAPPDPVDESVDDTPPDNTADDSNFDQVLRGSIEADTLTGSDGNDYIIGGGVFEGDGIDVVFGGAGDDAISSSGPLTQEDPRALNQLFGGAGDDIFLSSNANEMTGGEGSDTFGLSLTQYNGAGTGPGINIEPSIITDFNADEDVIVLEAGLVTQEGGTTSALEEVLTIVPWDDGTGADLVAGETVLARISGGQNISIDQIMIANNGLETMFLGFH